MLRQISLLALLCLAEPLPGIAETALDEREAMDRIRSYFKKHQVPLARTGELKAAEITEGDVRRFALKGQDSRKPEGRRGEPDWWEQLPPAKSNLTPSQEGAIGMMVAGRVMGDHTLYQDDKAAEYVNLVGRYVAEQSMRPDLDYQFFIIQAKEPQALSTPGGYVFISLGLLKRLKEEDELAFALGHEIAHVARYHGILAVENAAIKRRSEDAFDELDAHAATGSQELDLNVIADEAYTVAKFFRSRTEEIEADALGVDFAVRGGYRRDAGLAVLKLLHQVLGDQPEENSDASTHPTFGDRIENLEAHLDEFVGNPHRKMTLTRWRFSEFQENLK